MHKDEAMQALKAALGGPFTLTFMHIVPGKDAAKGGKGSEEGSSKDGSLSLSERVKKARGVSFKEVGDKKDGPATKGALKGGAGGGKKGAFKKGGVVVRQSSIDMPDSESEDYDNEGFVDEAWVSELKNLAVRFGVKREGQRKQRRISASLPPQELDSILRKNMFVGSAILANDSSQEGWWNQCLFWCLPFNTDGTAPICGKPVYASHVEHSDSHRDSTAHGEGWSLVDLRDKLEQETDEEDPLVFLMRSGDEVFGAVATEGFMFDGKYNGTSRCMMFSLTRDVLIPFTNRVAEPGVACPAMYSDKDEIRWGGKSAGGDLVLRDGDGAFCSSELEGSYGLGMSKQLATMCLAGTQKFKVDDLEVYTLQYR